MAKTKRTTQNYVSLLYKLAPYLLVIIYILLASVKIHSPGIQYDEALYVNAALGGIDKISFITKSVAHIPLLLMPYIGALKSYIYFPIFKLFGVSALTMRLPAVLLTALGLWVLYRLLKNQTRPGLALGVLAITALDASFIIFTRLDNGPVVLDFLLKITALFWLFIYCQKLDRKYLIVFWVAMFLGVFNKLNFIWYVNAFSAAFLLIYGRDIWHRLPAKRRNLDALIGGAGYFVCVGYFLFINHIYELGSSLGFVGFRMAYHNLQTLVSGNWFYNYALSAKQLGTPAIFWIMLAVIGSGFLYAILINKTSDRSSSDTRRFFIFLGTMSILLFGQIIMTLKATAGWHYFSVYPFFGALFVLAVFHLASATRQRLRSRLSYGLASALVLMVCGYNLFVYRAHVTAFSQPTTNFAWSEAIYTLVDFTKAHPDSQFISLDWGTHTQLLGLDGVRDKFFEVIGPLNIDNPASNEHAYRTYLAGKKNAYYIAHVPGQEIFPRQRLDFLELAEQHGYKIKTTQTIDDQGKPIFEIYSFGAPIQQ